jgi:photoactive yellow protein
MNELLQMLFAESDIQGRIQGLDDSELDGLEFGVIGFDSEAIVRRYNAFEMRCAGLPKNRVVGQPLFTVVAPCMNNFLVAQRFEEAAATGGVLDVIIDYVLTLRMRPAKVRLRLLASPHQSMRYVLVSGRDQ